LAKDVPHATRCETGHSHMRTPYEEVVPTSFARIAHRGALVAIPRSRQWGSTAPSVKLLGGAKKPTTHGSLPSGCRGGSENPASRAILSVRSRQEGATVRADGRAHERATDCYGDKRELGGVSPHSAILVRSVL
jgi:hypothetical protein